METQNPTPAVESAQLDPNQPAAAAPTTAATDDELGLRGNVLELSAEAEEEAAADPLKLQRHALQSRLHTDLGELIARPVSEWGLMGEGDSIDGHMVLVDVDTLQKVRAWPGSKVPAGKVFCNGRNLPAAVLESL